MINEKFISKAKSVHLNKYDYSLTNYINTKIKIKIICPHHGVFEQTPHHHVIRKQGCKKCQYINNGLNSRFTTKNFIEKSINIHGDKYDYSLVNYTTMKIKIKIICPHHGVFEQTPDNHIKGQNCGKCAGLGKTINDFILKANMTHNNKYDYSLVKYVSQRKKVMIICSNHGVFNQTPYLHANLKQGCPKCVGRGKTTADFINEANIKHNDKYDYSLVNYKHSKKKINILCTKHGKFSQTPNDHLRGKGCPICKESKGEQEISNLLKNHDINFISQHKFKNCRNILPLPFDFYLPDYNICIEYDGRQHYEPIDYFGGENGLLKIKENDLIKNKFCAESNIKLIRIPYNKKLNINSIIS